jgi:ubiquinone/menaquinone biosynthesis C-methylase UbiE
MPKSNIEWQAYGKLDYGASNELEMGIKEWKILREHLRQYGFERTGSCVEIGCGGGRLTNALAQHFDHVHTLDVSEDRLQRAAGLPFAHKCSFHLVSEPVIPLPTSSCDLAITTHVLQHIQEKEVTDAYFREMYRVLNSGGVMLVHIPVVGAHGTTGSIRELVFRRFKESTKEVVLKLTRGLMSLGWYALPWKIDKYRFFSFAETARFLEELGFQEVELRILPWAGYHSYVFAKKP